MSSPTVNYASVWNLTIDGGVADKVEAVSGLHFVMMQGNYVFDEYGQDGQRTGRQMFLLRDSSRDSLQRQLGVYIPKVHASGVAELQKQIAKILSVAVERFEKESRSEAPWPVIDPCAEDVKLTPAGE